MAIDLTEANLHKTGAGNAFVWGENKALRGLQQQQQQDALRKQKEESEMADQLAKISIAGVRDKDVPDVIKDYEEIKNSASKINLGMSSMDRRISQSKVSQQMMMLQQKVANYKDVKALIGEGVKLGFDKPNDVSDQYAALIKDLNDTPSSDPSFRGKVDRYHAGALAPAFDEISLIKKIAPLAVEPVQGEIKSRRIDGGTERFRQEGNKLNADNFAQQIVKEATSNRGLQRYITQAYPNMNIADATLAYAQQRAKDIAANYGVKEKIVDKNMDDTFYAHRNYSIANPLSVNYNVNQNPINLSVPMGNRKDPTGNFMQKGVIKMSTASMNFAGSPAYDLKTGKKVTSTLPSSNDYQVVSVSNMDFIKDDLKDADGKRSPFSGTISQPNFAEKNPNEVDSRPMIHVQYKEPQSGLVKNLAIPYDRMPQNLSKQNRAILATFKPAAKQAAVEQQKSYKTTYGTFSEEQLKSQYGDRWKDALKKMQ